MSIVAYYARLSSEQLIDCIQAPEMLATASVGQLLGAEIIDVDRSWEPMSWLVSPLKRREHQHNALVMGEFRSDRPPRKQTITSRMSSMFKTKRPPGVSAAVAASLKRVDETPLDLPLVAIEGRTDRREERLNFGMGATAVFSPEEVPNLHSALAAIALESLAQHLHPESMDRLGVFPAHWVEESRDLMDNYVVPNFKRLRSFYGKAAQEKQAVLVWYV